MEVCITVPEDLVKYVEYIPEEALPGILTDLIRKAILEPKSEKAAMPIDITAFSSLLQQSLSSINLNHIISESGKDVNLHGAEVKEVECADILKVKMPNEVIEYQENSDEFDEEDDLDDFMALMK